MKIIKRDGRIVEYNREKIEKAIMHANNDVLECDRVNKKQIDNIIKHIEELNKKRMLVEDIQDMIETELMKLKKFNLAKAYIIYRYKRALVRKSNTTDESILSLIKNNSQNFDNNSNNQNIVKASTQRDLIAAEVSKDLTKRILLPEIISEANDNGILYFHNADYFLQPIFNSCLINYQEIFENEIIINEKIIDQPRNFQDACLILSQIIINCSNNQYGGESINIKYLSKYLKIYEDELTNYFQKNYENKIAKDIIKSLINEEIKNNLQSGVKVLYQQLNTLIDSNNDEKNITFFLHLDDNDKYIDYTKRIIEEIFKQTIEGIKREKENNENSSLIKLVYVLDEKNNLTGGKYDYLTKLAIKTTHERLSTSYLSAKKMKENYDGNIFSPIGHCAFLTNFKNKNGLDIYEGRFNQGIVTINLPQVGIIANGDENIFWPLLEERLDLCFEALMCRYHALLGTSSNISPIHWQYGIITKLKKDEKIDNFLKNGYSTLSLGYIGLYEVTKLMKNVSHTNKEGEKFALKLIKFLKTTCDKWQKETKLGFNLYAIDDEKLSNHFALIDKEKYGIIKDITDKEYYTSSFHVNGKEKINSYEKITFESQFQNISKGGSITYLENQEIEELENIIKFAYDNIQYISFIEKED